MDKSLKDRIENICIRFEHSVTELDVLDWLENFSEGDVDNALTVLSMFNYYSIDRIIGCLKYSLERILSDYPNKKPHILPLGKAGKSGPFMAYYAKKVIDVYFEGKDSQKAKVKLIRTNDEVKGLDPGKALLVYLDDFAGSGDTFFSKRSKVEAEGQEVCYLTVAYMWRVKEKMDRVGVSIYGDIQTPCFARRGSVFGYEPKMKKVREFCYYYGNKLCPALPGKDLMPFGYKNSQALIAFEHTTPNNTLPIIWYDDDSIPWKPLFPRFVNSRNMRAESFRSGRNYWLSILYACGPSSEAFLNLPRYSAVAARLYILMVLIRRKHAEPFIMQFLGISEGELENIFEIGKSLNFIDSNKHLMPNGVRVIEEVERRDQILKAHHPQALSTNKNRSTNKKRIYIPKTFQGLS